MAGHSGRSAVEFGQNIVNIGHEHRQINVEHLSRYWIDEFRHYGEIVAYRLYLHSTIASKHRRLADEYRVGHISVGAAVKHQQRGSRIFYFFELLAVGSEHILAVGYEMDEVGRTVERHPQRRVVFAPHVLEPAH